MFSPANRGIPSRDRLLVAGASREYRVDRDAIGPIRRRRDHAERPRRGRGGRAGRFRSARSAHGSYYVHSSSGRDLGTWVPLRLAVAQVSNRPDFLPFFSRNANARFRKRKFRIFLRAAQYLDDQLSRGRLDVKSPRASERERQHVRCEAPGPSRSNRPAKTSLPSLSLRRHRKRPLVTAGPAARPLRRAPLKPQRASPPTA